MKEAPSYQVKKWKKGLKTLKENTQEKKNKYLHEKKKIAKPMRKQTKSCHEIQPNNTL